MPSSLIFPHDAQPHSRCLSLIAALIALHFISRRARYPYRYYGIASPLKRCLAPPVRFVFRYYQKQREHHRIQPLSIDYGTRSDLISTKGLLKPRATDTTPPGQATFGLALVLERYPPCVAIAKSLHYVDLKNMLLVSRAVHNALVSTAESYETLRRNSCDRETETACWGCRSQVCDVGPPSREDTNCDTLIQADHVFN